MKKVSKTLALVLCLALILSLTALANWYTYGGSNSHNHVVTSAPLHSPPASTAPPSISEVELLNAGGGWDGMDTEPIMKTVGTGSSAETYAFVLYDGHASGATLGRIKCSDGSLVNTNVSSATGFQLSTPVLVEPTTANGLSQDAIFVASAASTEKLAVLTDSAWSFSSTAGTPTSTSLPTTGNNLVTLTQTGISMDTSHTYRLYLGIWVGTSSNNTGSVTVTTKINGNTATVLDNSTNVSGTSVTLSGTPLEDEENPGNYYYYYNVNLLNLSNYSLTSSNSVSFEVNITSGNSGGTFEIRKPSMISNKGSIKKFTDLYGDRPVADGSFQPKVSGIALEINQQINTPITTDGTYLYFGTWGGANTAGSYYQVKISNGVTKVFTPSNYGFYWAGAACDTDNVYFGSDNGMLYWRSRTSFGSSTYGGSLNLTDTSIGGASDAGNVRSTIMIDSGKLYFTSQGGYLWCCSFENGALKIDWKTALRNSANTANVTCTSTPTKVGNRIYVGCYGGAGKSGIKYIDASTHQEKYVIQDNSLTVQCSIVVKGTGTDSSFLDYLYFVTNANTPYGMAYCYSWDGTNATLIWSSATATPTWDTSVHALDRTFALGGIAIENGIAVYGNDHNYVYIVK